MRKKIVAITLEFNKKKKYVTDFFFRESDQKYIISGNSDKPEDAHDFENMSAANAVLIRINNPYNREYKVETPTIQVKKSTHQDQRLA